MTFSLKGIKHIIIFWALAAALLLSDAAFYLYFLKPAQRSLANIENEYQMKRVERRPAAGSSVKADTRLKGLYEELPRWEDFTRVMGEVYSKAERLNLLIESAAYQSSPVKDSGFMKVVVSMPVTGSYAEIKRFIYDLETSPRFFIIESLSLGSGKGEEGDISLKLTIAAHFKG